MAQYNDIRWSGFGGAVFDEAGSVGGSFIANTFISNGHSGNCNGVNVIGLTSGVYFFGNYVNTGSAYCNL